MRPRWQVAAIRFTAALALLGGATLTPAAPPKDARESKAEGGLRAAPIKAADWLNASEKPIQPGEVDKLVAEQLKSTGAKPTPRTTDEQFVRRVYLDLTGRTP